MKKKGIWGDYLVYIIIAAAVLVVSLVLALIYSGKFESVSDFINNFLRFGR